MLLESTEELVARLRGLQSVVGEVARIAVQDAPVVGLSGEGIHLLKLQVLPTGLLVVDHVVSTRVTEYLGQIVLAAHSVPRAVMHLSREDAGALCDLRGSLLQRIVTLLDTVEYLTGLALLTDEHPHELDPLSLPQRVELLIAEVGHEGDTRLLDGLIATALRGRDEDHLRIGSEHHLRVEVALHTYLHDAPVLRARQDIGVKEVLRTRDALHHVVGIEDGEVRELQRRHTDGALHRHLDARIALGHLSPLATDEGEAVMLTHLYEAHASRVLHRVARRITGFHKLQSRQTVSRPLCLSTATPATTSTGAEGQQGRQKNTQPPHHHF